MLSVLLYSMQIFFYIAGWLGYSYSFIGNVLFDRVSEYKL